MERHPRTTDTADEVVVGCTAVAAGGDGICRLPDGRVVFVPGALPDERLRVRVVERKRDFARARIVAIVQPSPDRVVPACPKVAEGCGGCAWQHVAVDAQPRLKRSMVTDALRRLGKVPDPERIVRLGPVLPATGSRSTVRAAVVPTGPDAGRAGFRAAGSHRVVAAGACPVAHPVLARLLAEGRFPGGEEVGLRTAVATGETLVVVSPTRSGVELPPDVAGLTLVGSDEVRAGLPSAVHEVVGDRSFRVSAGSFFQARPDGATVLVESVAAALAGAVDAGSARLVDLYSGVGLFAATVGAGFAEVVCVESNPVAVADARHNLAWRGSAATVVEADVDWWSPSPARAGTTTVVVADPARSGLGRAGVATAAACDPLRVVLVSCDAASLARDAALLREAGFALRDAVLVDLFPHTAHVEVVSRFDRQGVAGGPR